MRGLLAGTGWLLLLALATTGGAVAATKAWNCDVGNWATSGCWLPTGVPNGLTDVTVSPVTGLNSPVVTVSGIHQAGSLTLNSTTAPTRTVTLSIEGAGNLQVNLDAIVGSSGKATVQQSAGTFRVVDTLFLANDAGSEGTYTFSGGSGDFAIGRIGYRGTGAVTQSAGTISFTTLDLASQSGSTGTYTLSGTGSLSSTFAYLGSTGTGTFVQSSGTNGVTNTFYLGVNAGTGNGTYTMQGGTLQTNAAYVGASGVGYLDQSGGTHTTTGTLYLGYNASGSGGYQIAGASTQLSAGAMQVGRSGTGNVTQTGGTVNVGGTLSIAQNAGSTGSYTLTGGNLLAAAEQVGVVGTGRFVQTGGVHTLTNALTVGAFTGSTGTFDLFAGSLSSKGLVVGTAGGQGTVTQTGGTHTVDGTFTLANTADSRGTYNLSGGTLAVDTLVRGPGTSAFNWSGGTLNVQNPYTVTDGTFFGSSFAVGAGRAFVASTLTIAGDGMLELQGGAMTVTTLANNGELRLRSGTLGASTVNNAGTATFSGATATVSSGFTNTGILEGRGTLAGATTFANQNLFRPVAGTFTLANTGSRSNLGIVELAAGSQLVVSLGTFTNSGSIVMSGGVLAGSGSVTTGTSGQVTGYGRISAPYANQGLLGVSGGTLAVESASFVNSGQIQLAGFGANLTGGTITNTGTIQGAGSIGNAVTNTGTIEALGGTLAFSSAGNTNSGAGLIAVGSGTKVLMSGGLASNAGLILLDGGTFDNGGKALANAQRIVGAGTLRTGSLQNDGQMAFSFGNSSVSGAIDNRMPGTVVVSNGSQVTFAHDLVNRGELRISQGGAANFFGLVSGDGIFAGDGQARFEGGFAPGGSPAIVTIGFRVTYGSGSTITMELGGTTPGNCDTCADKIVFNNAVTLQGGALNVVWWREAAGRAGDVYDLFDWNGTRTGTFGQVALPALASGLEWRTDQLYTTGEISVAAIPEPSTWATLVVGLGLVGLQLRRRARRAPEGAVA